MNSFVTALSETSVMSISCFEMRFNSRSNGPSKFDSETRNPASDSADGVSDAAAVTSSDSTDASVSGVSSGDGATGDQLPRQPQVRLGGGVLRSELGDGDA